MNVNHIFQGDALEIAKTLPDKSVHCIVTSPPYWCLRDYGVDGQLGLESTPEEYVEKLVELFRELRRVLRDDGTCWLNLGDSYGARKQLVGIPWRVALALQADGWILRSDIIWKKPNPMPESITDRPTKSHEYIFLLAKSQKYYYDNEAIKEQSITPERAREKLNGENAVDTKLRGFGSHCGTYAGGRNRRTVWNVESPVFKMRDDLTQDQKAYVTGELLRRGIL